MNLIIDYIKDNKLNILLGTMVLMSVFANFGTNGQLTYYAALFAFILLVMSKSKKFNFLFVLLPIWLTISSFVNHVMDLRIAVFYMVILCASPVFSSYEGFVRRGKLLYTLCMLLPIVTILNLYAYQAGINYFLMLSFNMSELNFSGFMFHPMWLGAINGASNVSLMYLLMKSRNMKASMLVQGALLALLLGSLYLSVVAASRSALASSLVAMASIVFFFSETSGRLIKSAFVIVVIASLAMPMFEAGSAQMQSKMDNEDDGGNSRSLIWNKRIEEFKDSPIFGVGFATAFDLVKNEMVTGTVETGSGWLTVLSQSGLVGGIIILLILLKCYVPIKEIKEDRGALILFYGFAIYLFVHSIFEGYIYTPGYCPCLFFWLVVGVLTEYNQYKDDYDDVLEEIEYQYIADYDDDDDDEEEDEDDENDDEYDDEDDDEDEYDDEDGFIDDDFE